MAKIKKSDFENILNVTPKCAFCQILFIKNFENKSPNQETIAEIGGIIHQVISL